MSRRSHPRGSAHLSDVEELLSQDSGSDHDDEHHHHRNNRGAGNSQSQVPQRPHDWRQQQRHSGGSENSSPERRYDDDDASNSGEITSPHMAESPPSPASRREERSDLYDEDPSSNASPRGMMSIDRRVEFSFHRDPHDEALDTETDADETAQQFRSIASVAATKSFDSADGPADPVDVIVQMLLVQKGRKQLPAIEKALDWETVYEDRFEDLRTYILSYKSVFILSPVSDMVVLRKLAIDTGHRRPARALTSKQNQLAENYWTSGIGSCSYTCVSESIDVESLQGLYLRRGMQSVLRAPDVLHVSYKGQCDVFVFDFGVVVWWGKDRSDHWLVEEDFITESMVTRSAIVERHSQSDIDELFPVWYTHQIASNHDVDSVMHVFEENICFDHLVLPGEEELWEAKLAISYAFANAARVDYFEHNTEELHDEVIRLSQETQESMSFITYFRKKRHLMEVKGALQYNDVLISDVGDVSEFFWEKPRYSRLYQSALQMNTVKMRREWFSKKCEAAISMIQTLDDHKHRIFMIRSDWILILLLVADVFFLLARLLANMYLL